MDTDSPVSSIVHVLVGNNNADSVNAQDLQFGSLCGPNLRGHTCCGHILLYDPRMDDPSR